MRQWWTRSGYIEPNRRNRRCVLDADMTTSSTRAGYSLPQVLVATVLLGVIGGALTKLVVSQMRFFDNITAVLVRIEEGAEPWSRRTPQTE